LTRGSAAWRASVGGRACEPNRTRATPQAWRGPRPVAGSGAAAPCLSLPPSPCPRTGGRGEGKGEGIDYQAARGVERQRCITWLMVPYTGTLRVVAQGTHKRTVMRRWRASPQGETPRAEFGGWLRTEGSMGAIAGDVAGRAAGRDEKAAERPPNRRAGGIGDGAEAGCGARWRPRASGGRRPRVKRLPRARMAVGLCPRSRGMRAGGRRLTRIRPDAGKGHRGKRRCLRCAAKGGLRPRPCSHGMVHTAGMAATADRSGAVGDDERNMQPP
jgi:hypothetical protein